MPDANSFIDAVRNMRQAQKDYFRTRDRDVLEKCKRLEQSVDETLRLTVPNKHITSVDDLEWGGCVLALRAAQHSYFRTRSTQALDLSRRLEKRIDAMLSAIGDPAEPGLFEGEI